MQRKFKILCVVLMLALPASVWAQTEYTLYSIGFIGGKKSQPSTNSYYYSSGHVGSTLGFNIVPNELSIQTGFPYNVLYFKRVFDKPMFVSKGFFADYVQLQWEVVHLASSIKRIKIFRKPVGAPGDSLIVATLAADNSSWKDEFAERGVIYEYTLFAEGLADDLRLPYVNIMQGVGFALPTGRVSGRITFEGGTAVEGASVLAETDGNLTGRSLSFDGTSAFGTVGHLQGDNELEIRTGFTLQAWARWDGSAKGVLFSKGSQYDLAVESNQITFKVGSATVVLPYVPPVDSFFHVTAVYNPGVELKLYAHVNDERVDSAKVAAGTQPVASLDNIFFGKNLSGNFYQGNIDEIRLWAKAFTYAETRNNYSRYISGTETNLIGYWRLNEGVGPAFYDFARKGFAFNENHATITHAQWSEDTPLRSQLAFRGVTDASGNYTINGFPYETDGSLYRFTPMLGEHQFDPNQQIRLISNGISTINELNFKDISSFEVTGTVRYRNTTFPVEGVSILVDGKPATNVDAQLITTDNQGRFSLHVPIGKHSLRIAMNGHSFENEGRFPPPAPSIPVPLFDFQEAVIGLEFIDTTLVKVAGRVAGGPVEAGKILGFGKSKNNLGNTVINMTTEKGHDISLSDSTHNYDEDHMVASANFNTKNVKIFPDANTGEFVAYLLPERYKVTGVTSGTYIFDPSFNVTVNLKEAIWQNEVLKDTVEHTLNGTTVPMPPYDPTKYDTLVTSVDGVHTWKIAIDSFFYQKKQSFIYRTTPTLSVTNRTGEELFGDTQFKYENPTLGITQTIPLIQNGQYTFGHPVFNDRQIYRMYISLFEEYTNNITNVTSKVPVTDGKIDVVNNLAINTGKQTLSLDAAGKAVYVFRGGLPEINKDNITPANSFTKTISITAFSGNNGAIQTVWRPTNPLRGFVLGGLPVGNNFVTTGPTEMVTILRDPPGSGSSTSLQTGRTKSSITQWSSSHAIGEEASLTMKLGQNVIVFAGVGAGVIKEAHYDHDVSVGLSSEQLWLNDNEYQTNITTTKTWSTSGESDFVGDRADVFVGFSTNIIYGQSKIIDIIPVTSCATCLEKPFMNYDIGLRDGLRLNPEISTGFMHTVGHIEDVVLPGLAALRNSFLVYAPNPATVQPKVVTAPSDKECTANAIYVSLIPQTDPRFGTANTDTLTWENAAARSSIAIGMGPSYRIIRATGCDNSTYHTDDTIQYFNQQIKEWEFWLRENERQKIKATKEVENLAFDAGATFQKSVTMDTTSTTTHTFEWNISPSVALNLGFDFDGFGLNVAASINYTYSGSDSETEVTTNAVTYDYTLSDGDATDYYSVNVRKPDDGFGPVFRVNGGATSCPYQGEVKTTWYKENNQPVVLSPASVMVDAPSIESEQAVVAGIASNRPAEFTLLLRNNSGIGADRWYILRVDDATNPYGAVLEIDGAPIANGRSFMVKAGETLQKSLRVRMGRPDIMDYEDLRLTLSSLCDDGNEDAVEISAFFIPGCTDIVLDIPKENWVMNTNNTPVDSLLLKLAGYDRDHDNFKQIVFQYKPSGSSQWTTDMVFYNPTNVTTAEFNAAQEPKQLISGPEVLYYWDMHSQPDRNYDVRAKSVCELGPAVFVETPTEIIKGIKDVKRPQLFGSPQPADGVLSTGEEISVQFDETIEASLLTPFNFSVQAVLNGSPLNHNTSVEFDGVNDRVRMSEGLNLTSSFTVEFWLKRNAVGRQQVVFSKGADNGDIFEIGFTPGNQLFVKFGNLQILTSKVFPETDWYHYAIAYDEGAKRVSAYRNDVAILENVNVLGTFTGSGEISVGQSLFTNNDLFAGNIHELRIWTKPLSLGDAYARMSQSLSGNEIGLVGYWPFDEANGKLAHDKARFRHGVVDAEWLVLPKGRAIGLDGINDFFEMNTGSTVIISEEMDFTIEFWFRGGPGQQNATMFSSGKGDGTDNFNAGSWSIGFDASGKLRVLSNGIGITLTEHSLLNDSWHHFAMSVNRKGNTNLFVDGVLAKSQASAGLSALYGLKMWLGARGYKTGTLTTVQDQFFRGAIDEFRVWSFSKKQNQIELASNAKLVGDELGLVAYYPFEFYTTSVGIKVVNPTMTDQWQNPNGPNGGAGNAAGGSTFSTLTPNIKDSRPLQKVDFDWAVNDDKIIITPSVSMAAAIEKTILEITVSRVEDKFENRIASPVSWTAFVDRNQLKWGDDALTMEKILYEPLTFTSDVINHGGTQQNFVINNLPAWLKASPQSGIISPLSRITVTFTIDEGLNTGVYQEDIYLKSDFGFDEKLILNLRNYTPVPAEWKVNPGDFQYSMNVDGQIKVNGKISNNPFDYLAAFVGDQCRGVARLQYVEAFDNYQAFLTIYGNQQGGEDVTFRIWSANEGQVYTNVTPALQFVANAVHGIPSSPVIFESVGNVLENKVDLPEGWKWISFNLSSEEMKQVNNIVKINGTEGDQIKGKVFYDTYNEAQGWVGSITSNGGLKNEEMYKAFMHNAVSFKYAGKFPNALPIPIVAGWNWIGYVSTFNLGVNEALATLNATQGDLIKGQHSFATYEPAMGWIGSLTFMKPGEGYMYRAQANGMLVYPKVSSLGGRKKDEQEENPETIWQLNPYAFNDNMNIIAEVTLHDGSRVEGDDLLGAFVNGECRGIAKPILNPLTNQYGFFLTMSGDANSGDVHFRYYRGGEKAEYPIKQTLKFLPNILTGTNRNPFMLSTEGHSLDGVSIYPNPFTTEVGIQMKLPKDQGLESVIVDVTGRAIRHLPEPMEGSDNIKLIWDGKNDRGDTVGSGVYFLQITANGESHSYRIVKF